MQQKQPVFRNLKIIGIWKKGIEKCRGQNAMLHHFSLAIPCSEKVACFNKKVKLLVKNHFAFKCCFRNHQMKVQLYLYGLWWVKKICPPPPVTGKKNFLQFCIHILTKNVEMSRTLSSLRFLRKTLSHFKNAKVTIVPM